MFPALTKPKTSTLEVDQWSPLGSTPVDSIWSSFSLLLNKTTTTKQEQKQTKKLTLLKHSQAIMETII